MSSGAGGAVVVAVGHGAGEGGDFDVAAGAGCVQDVAVAGVDGDVAEPPWDQNSRSPGLRSWRETARSLVAPYWAAAVRGSFILGQNAYWTRLLQSKPTVEEAGQVPFW